MGGSVRTCLWVPTDQWKHAVCRFLCADGVKLRTVHGGGNSIAEIETATPFTEETK